MSLDSLLKLPRYGPVGLHDPQQDVEVWLRGNGDAMNVTRNNVVVALRPFTIGVMFDRRDCPEQGANSLQLSMHETREPKRLRGVIHLRPSGSIFLDVRRLCLFETTGYENYCAPALSMQFYYRRAKRRAAEILRKNPHNFQMTQTDLRCSYVFYVCPRPVVLVSVEHEGLGNMFPMDLIGPTDSPWFTMALRGTSPAVKLMQESRRMALGSIPIAYKDVVYELGKHHKVSGVDWSALPLKTEPSPLYALPVPAASLRIREVRVREFHEIGSHVLFITSIEKETIREQREPQLFHSFAPA